MARKWFYNDINKAYFYGHPSTGAIFTGWHKINGYWYYFSLDDMTTEDGSRYYWCGGMYDYGAALIKGNWYYLAKSDNASKWGKMQTGWIKESGTYSHSDGSKWTYRRSHIRVYSHNVSPKAWSASSFPILCSLLLLCA